MQGVFAVIFTVIFLVLELTSTGFGFFEKTAIAVVLTTPIFFTIWWLWVQHLQRAATKSTEQLEALLKKTIEECLASHPTYAPTLERIWNRTVYIDEFGDKVFDRWWRELDRFIREKRPVSFDVNDKAQMARVSTIMFDVLCESWKTSSSVEAEDAQRSVAALAKEFEESCGELFTACGFETTLTGASGDQGADVIGTREGMRVVAQCKLYGKPVGNAAVQQAESARQFYDAQFAMVITNAAFTPAARQLADKLGVWLVPIDTLGAVLTAAAATCDAQAST